MKKILQKLCIAFGVLLIMVGSGGWTFTYLIDHREARSLSAYCDIDFQTGFNERGQVSSATLSIIDHRYARHKLLPKITLICDKDRFEISGVSKQLPPTYSLSPFDDRTSFKNTNKIFVEFPFTAYQSMRRAGIIKVRFAYENGDIIELPLDEHDIAYWKEHLQDKK